MQISVVTISYNQRKYLDRCVETIDTARQAYLVEHICVDAGSTDGSIQYLQSSNRDQLLVGVDDGPAEGLNKGFAVAQGEVFGFINADDEVLPNCFEYILDFFAQNPEADVLLASGRIIDDSGRFVKSIRASRFTARDYVFNAVTLFQQGMFFRRGVFDKLGGFNVRNKTCWDGELALNFCLINAVMHETRDQIACFRLHPQSITGSGRLSERYGLDQARLFEKVMNRRPRVTDLLERTWRRAAKLGRERDRFGLR